MSLPGTVVVLILSHTAPEQVARLVRRLETGSRTAVFIHHDPTGSPLRGVTSSRVELVPEPVSCSWGRVSIVDAVTHSLEVIRTRVPDLAWVLLVSGADYPIRTMRSIEAELASAPYDAFLRSFPIGRPEDDVVPWQALCRRRYFRSVRAPFSSRSIPLPISRPTPFNASVTAHVGDLWVNLAAVSVSAILDSPSRSRIRRYAATVAIPDELVVPTLVHAGIPRERIAHDHRRYIEWPEGPSPHPAVLGLQHLPAITASEAFFARKLAPDDRELPDLLDQHAESRPT